MEPPAVFAQEDFQVASPARDCEQHSLMMVGRSDWTDVAQIQAHDQIHLAPRVRRFFSAYLAVDPSRRADLRKAVAYASRRFEFDAPAAPSLKEDIAAALAIGQKAANIACATDIDEMIDGADSGSIDADLLLLADAFATIALAYRYVVGLYVADSTLGDLGEASVGLALLAEREQDSVLSTSSVREEGSARSYDAFASNIEISSNPSVSEPPAASQNEELTVSLDTISQRLREQILLMA
jgi:hypothetical protein